MEDKYCYPCDEPVVDKRPPCPNQCQAKCPSYKEKPENLDLTTKPFIWLIGGPGVGKETQCKLIANKYGLTPVSVGNLVHAEIQSKSTRAKCLLSAVMRGELLPNDHILDLLKKEILKTASSSKGFVISGFPREVRQGWLFEKNIAPVSLVLYFEASDQTLTHRLLARNKPSNKICDNTDTIKIQLRKFHEQNRNIVPQYPHRLVKINAERTQDQIFQDVQPAVEEVIADHNRRIEAKKAKEKREKEEDEKDSMFPKPKSVFKEDQYAKSESFKGTSSVPPSKSVEPAKKPEDSKAKKPEEAKAPVSGPPSSKPSVEAAKKPEVKGSASPPSKGSPPVASPPKGSPLAASPPKGSPPATSPPKGSPPAASPPKGSPLAASPPKGSPLVASPPSKGSPPATSPNPSAKPSVEAPKKPDGTSSPK